MEKAVMSFTQSAALSIASRYRANQNSTAKADLLDVLGSCQDLPLPGSGHTLARWRRLADVAALDLVCAKLFESHTDALAILAELGQTHLIEDEGLWAVWCAEPPSHRVHLNASPTFSDGVSIHGTKAWCSGANEVSHALISCWDENNKHFLVAVDMDQPGVIVTTDGWQAVGMGATESVDVIFDYAEAQQVSSADQYIQRPGFLHGAAGIAACWYGAAASIAHYLIQHVQQRPDDVHAQAHLGVIDIALAQAASLLRVAAHAIDHSPTSPCEREVWRARLAVEAAVETVLQRVPRALGAGPLCKQAHLANQMADLPVFLRQSHAERDLAAHGIRIAQEETAQWKL
ncbi:MAG TPA: acyl-CoA dehydrogenase [Paenalcaligenes hominis]|uniref:Acyl-CoA dehydrogenase n=1 Tax=Paenalcaligenes hominis TaxID=643674 RepID=A0A9D2VH63_9BURK|nr:acyl-CoA dehydrogenase [Paenalcaligenes hominis]